MEQHDEFEITTETLVAVLQDNKGRYIDHKDEIYWCCFDPECGLNILQPYLHLGANKTLLFTIFCLVHSVLLNGTLSTFCIDLKVNNWINFFYSIPFNFVVRILYVRMSHYKYV